VGERKGIARIEDWLVVEVSESRCGEMGRSICTQETFRRQEEVATSS